MPVDGADDAAGPYDIADLLELEADQDRRRFVETDTAFTELVARESHFEIHTGRHHIVFLL